MLEEIFIIIGLLALVAIVFIKFLNVLNRGKNYSKEMIFITFFLGMLFWGLTLTGVLVSSAYQQNGTITDASGTTTLVLTDNSVYAASQFFGYANLLLLLLLCFSAFEIFFLFSHAIIQPKKAISR